MLEAYPSFIEPSSICLLTGIVGGLWTPENDIRLGDVVIGTKIWDWRDGIETEGGFRTSAQPTIVSNRIRGKLPRFLYVGDKLGKEIWAQREVIKNRHDAREKDTYLPLYRPEDATDVLYKSDYERVRGLTCVSCDIPCTEPRPKRAQNLPVVHVGMIASGHSMLRRANLREFLQDHDVLAVEMEACALVAFENLVAIKGVGNYADNHKNKGEFHAAANAAACARALINFMPPFRKVQSENKT